MYRWRNTYIAKDTHIVSHLGHTKAMYPLVTKRRLSSDKKKCPERLPKKEKKEGSYFLLHVCSIWRSDFTFSREFDDKQMVWIPTDLLKPEQIMLLSTSTQKKESELASVVAEEECRYLMIDIPNRAQCEEFEESEAKEPDSEEQRVLSILKNFYNIDEGEQEDGEDADKEKFDQYTSPSFPLRLIGQGWVTVCYRDT